ncbi:hypothetical protein [Lichenibacterium dinghuense]|uniref:hypothetical protein n=1 Tax=Lichenibacterium dinghuense TaxID=2895977 RepID=UPI001F262CDF|nr:hypothetical protein [Lichenibacterium sp. 6Y81]
MGRTVFFTSRCIGDPVRTLDVRCDFLQFEPRPNVVQRGAGGDVQMSIMPPVVMLANVDEHDLSDLKAIIWTEIAWDDEHGRRQQRMLKLAELCGGDLRCVVG